MRMLILNMEGGAEFLISVLDLFIFYISVSVGCFSIIVSVSETKVSTKLFITNFTF